MKAEYVLNRAELDKFAAMLKEMGDTIIRTSENSFKLYDARKSRDQGRLRPNVAK